MVHTEDRMSKVGKKVTDPYPKQDALSRGLH